MGQQPIQKPHGTKRQIRSESGPQYGCGARGGSGHSFAAAVAALAGRGTGVGRAGGERRTSDTN